VAVLAAGERWPDGSLRPAAEDLIGAGAIVAGLDPAGASPEAQLAAAAFWSVSESLDATLLACASGRELRDRGFAVDVHVAASLDASEAVPVIGDDGGFANAAVASPG
jgi:2-phosphosulfolactate phosphatase